MTKSNEDIFNSIKGNIYKIYDMYAFINLDTNMLNIFVYNIIKNNNDKYQNDRLIEYVKDELINKLNNIVKDKLYKDPKLLNKYIKFIYDNKDINYVNKLNNIGEFIENNNITTKEEKLIDDIEELRLILENIVSLSKDVTESITSNKALELYDIYCVNNNIEMDIELDEFEYFVNDNTSDFDNLKLYFADINSKYRKLTKEEQVELINRYKNGDTKAFDTLIECNLKLVVCIGLKFLNRGLELSDLIEEGNIGLINAINKFDATKNTKFSTYATYWIKQNISKAIASKSRTVRLPFHLHEKLDKFYKAITKLSKELNREPEVFEIAKEMNISEEKVIEYYNISLDTVSINSIVGDEDTELEYFIEDKNENVENNYINKDLSEHIKKLLEKANLTDKEKTIIKLRYGFYGRVYKLEEIGKMFNCTRERIRQIENHVLRILKNSDYIKHLVNYLDNPDIFNNDNNKSDVNFNKANPNVVKTINKIDKKIEKTSKDIKIIEDDTIDDVSKLKKLLKKINLTDREITIYLLRKGVQGKIHTLEEIGNMFNCTRERIRQIECKIIERIRKSHYVKEIEYYTSNKKNKVIEKIEYKYLNGRIINNLFNKCKLDEHEKEIILLKCGNEDNIIKTNDEIKDILNLSKDEFLNTLNNILYYMNMCSGYIKFTDDEYNTLKLIENIIINENNDINIRWTENIFIKNKPKDDIIIDNSIDNIETNNIDNTNNKEDNAISNTVIRNEEDNSINIEESNIDNTVNSVEPNNDVLVKDVIYDLKLNDEVILNNIFKKLSNLECIILTLFLGLDLEVHSIEDIASFLKLDKEYVFNIITKSLEMYKNEVNDKINNFLLIKNKGVKYGKY